MSFGIDQYLKFIWFSPSFRDFLSIVSNGSIVSPYNPKEMIPSAPFF